MLLVLPAGTYDVRIVRTGKADVVLPGLEVPADRTRMKVDPVTRIGLHAGGAHAVRPYSRQFCFRTFLISRGGSSGSAGFPPSSHAPTIAEATALMAADIRCSRIGRVSRYS